MGTGHTPEFGDVMRQAMSMVVGATCVAKPAVVKKVTPVGVGKYLLDVTPTIKEARPGINPLALPTVCNVPLMLPSCGVAVLDLPVTIGDVVLLVHADRSIDIWLEGDGTKVVDPQDPRLHNMTDAFAIPLWAKKTVVGKVALIQVTPTGSILLKSGGSTVAVNPNGAVQITCLAASVVSQTAAVQATDVQIIGTTSVQETAPSVSINGNQIGLGMTEEEVAAAALGAIADTQGFLTAITNGIAAWFAAHGTSPVTPAESQALAQALAAFTSQRVAIGM